MKLVDFNKLTEKDFTGKNITLHKTDSSEKGIWFEGRDKKSLLPFWKKFGLRHVTCGGLSRSNDYWHSIQGCLTHGSEFADNKECQFNKKNRGNRYF